MEAVRSVRSLLASHAHNIHSPSLLYQCHRLSYEDAFTKRYLRLPYQRLRSHILTKEVSSDHCCYEHRMDGDSLGHKPFKLVGDSSGLRDSPYPLHYYHEMGYGYCHDRLLYYIRF